MDGREWGRIQDGWRSNGLAEKAAKEARLADSDNVEHPHDELRIGRGISLMRHGGIGMNMKKREHIHAMETQADGTQQCFECDEKVQTGKTFVVTVGVAQYGIQKNKWTPTNPPQRIRASTALEAGQIALGTRGRLSAGWGDDLLVHDTRTTNQSDPMPAAHIKAGAS